MCTPASLVLSGQTKTSLSKTGFCVLFYYLEGHGDLVSRLIMGIIGLMIWLIGVILSPHDPPSITGWRVFVGFRSEARPLYFRV